MTQRITISNYKGKNLSQVSLMKLKRTAKIDKLYMQYVYLVQLKQVKEETIKNCVS